MSDGEPTVQPLAYQSNQPPRPPTPVCPKCQSQMVQGTAFTAARSVAGRTLWVATRPVTGPRC